MNFNVLFRISILTSVFRFYAYVLFQELSNRFGTNFVPDLFRYLPALMCSR